MSGVGGWITNGTAVPFYARRLFLLEKKVKKAEAKVCGLGQFLLWVNGKKVGDHELGEYWETNPRSHCHDMMGHIIEWYYNGIAGILCEEPGFARIRICPYLPESMTTFTCSYMSVKGLIRVEVTKHEEETGKAPAGEAMENDKASAENGEAPVGESAKARCISERGKWIQLNITVPEQVEYTIDTSCLESQADRVEVNLERCRV